MAGRGPRPKDPSRRVRYDGTTQTVIEFEPCAQPELPARVEGWPAATCEWWESWRQTPLSDSFGVTDWQFLLTTALLHAEVWSGKLTYATELRLQVAKFGATPEDRARLRIQFAEADKADEKRSARPPASRDRFADLRLIAPAAGE